MTLKEREPWFHWHWQNLNEKPGRRKGSGLRHGRAWFRFGKTNFRVEWKLGDIRCAAALGLDEEDGLLWSICVPLLGSLWFAIGHNGWWPKRKRELSVRVFDWTIWFNLWVNPNGSWSTRTPRWRDSNIRLLDLLLGKVKYSERDLETVRVVVPMPEASYPATVKMFESRWKRPRWFPNYLLRAEITPDKPIPFPGKGENSWDCGEDATHSMTTAARNPEEAVGELIKSVLRDRAKNGGRDWVPSEAKQ